jgi:hypothetical protein
MESEMKRIILFTTVLLFAVAQAQAGQKPHVTKHLARHPASGVTVYDHDSPDPNIGWHTDSNGMRVCHNDCDNPEIPGSGARCHDVNVMGMAMRECVTGSSLL